MAAQPNADLLQLLASADVILGPFPFGGGNTTYEPLAVGTPVVTYPGRFLRGRISDALYHRMGMRSLVATDTATNTSHSPSGWRLTPISAISCLSN